MVYSPHQKVALGGVGDTQVVTQLGDEGSYVEPCRMSSNNILNA